MRISQIFKKYPKYNILYTKLKITIVFLNLVAFFCITESKPEVKVLNFINFFKIRIDNNNFSFIY